MVGSLEWLLYLVECKGSASHKAECVRWLPLYTIDGLPWAAILFIALFIVHKVIKPQARLLAGSIIDIEISCEYSLAVLYQSSVETLYCLAWLVSYIVPRSFDCWVQLCSIQWNLYKKGTVNKVHLCNADTVCSPNNIELCKEFPLN